MDNHWQRRPTHRFSSSSPFPLSSSSLLCRIGRGRVLLNVGSWKKLNRKEECKRKSTFPAVSSESTAQLYPSPPHIWYSRFAMQLICQHPSNLPLFSFCSHSCLQADMIRSSLRQSRQPPIHCIWRLPVKYRPDQLSWQLNIWLSTRCLPSAAPEASLPDECFNDTLILYPIIHHCVLNYECSICILTVAK